MKEVVPVRTFEEKEAALLREANFVKGVIHGAELKESMKAFNLMKHYHHDVRRKDGQLYTTHPIRVAHQLLALGIRVDSIIAAALLHDVIEDCRVTIGRLRVEGEFSYDTMNILEAVTKNHNIPTEDYYKFIVNGSGTPGSMLVKISDRLHNLSTMHGAFSKEKMLEYVEETYQYIIPMCSTLKYDFPEYANVVYSMKNQIETICEVYHSLLK